MLHIYIYNILSNIMYSALSPTRYILYSLYLYRSRLYFVILYCNNANILKALFATTGGLSGRRRRGKEGIVNVGLSPFENAWVKCQNPFECVRVYDVWIYMYNILYGGHTRWFWNMVIPIFLFNNTFIKFWFLEFLSTYMPKGHIFWSLVFFVLPT